MMEPKLILKTFKVIIVDMLSYSRVKKVISTLCLGTNLSFQSNSFSNTWIQDDHLSILTSFDATYLLLSFTHIIA